MRIKRHRRRKSILKAWLSCYTSKKTKKFSWFKFVVINSILGFISLILISVLYAWLALPSVKDADQLVFAESTIIYDRDALKEGENPDDHILYVIHGDENREYVKLENISPYAINALIAIEDDQFYSHIGFDLGGLIKAVLAELGVGPRRGGSTITQQLVKNTFLSNERSYLRKYNELLLAVKMELAYSKDEILEQYFNKVGYGSNSYGIEAASKTFFAKSAKELNVLEGAILAALVNRPSTYSPYGPNRHLLMGYYEENPELGTKEYKKGRKDLVLNRMLDLNMISFEEFSQVHSLSKTFEFTRAKADIKAPHFVFYVQEQIESKFGKEFLQSGGLRIYTTLDPKLQTTAEESIDQLSEFYEGSHGATNVALASINPDNGEIVAFVGGKDFFNQEIDGQVNVLTSRRQPGSSFKPMTFAAAFEEGYSPSTLVFDVETDFGGNYRPQNYSGEFNGPVTVREALNSSLNIPAVKMAELAKPGNVITTAERAGVSLDGNAWDHGVAIGLGVAEVLPLEHISSYQVFARDGSYFQPASILEVRNSEGEVLEKDDIIRRKRDGIDKEVAGLVRNILNDETARPTTNGFDWNTFLQLDGYDNGAKTGTSNRRVPNPDFNPNEPEDEEENPKTVRAPGDAWTIGYTPHLVTGVWVGNNRGEPMKFSGTGMTAAAPIWKNYMTKAHEVLVEEGADKEKPYPEIKLEERQINRFSGKLAGPETPEKLLVKEVFASFNVPTDLDDSVKIIPMDRTTGKPANRAANPRTVVEKIFITLASLRPQKQTWEAPVQDWIKENPNALSEWDIILTDTLPREEIEIIPPNARELAEARRQRDSGRRTAYSSNAVKTSFLIHKDGSTVVPGTLQVPVIVQSKYRVSQVDFLWNGEIVDSRTQQPWVGNIPVKEDETEGVLTVLAVDIRNQTGQNTIELKVGKDTEGPDITFLGPVGRQQIPLNSHTQVLVQALDEGAGTAQVEIYLDDILIATDTSAPFNAEFTATGGLGSKKLRAKATDNEGNVSERVIPIFFEREKTSDDEIGRIDNIKSYQRSVSVDVILPAADVMRAELVVKQNKQVVERIYINEPKSFQQFQIPRNYQGDATIELLIQTAESATLKAISTDFFDL